MQKKVYDLNLLKIMTLFENITQTKLKDAIDGPTTLTFIVYPGFIGKAIGKDATNIKNLSEKLNKKIKIVEFSEDKAKFVSNLLYPLRCDVSEINGVIEIKCGDTKTRGLAIGRESANLKNLKNIVERYYEIVDIKVCPN